MKENKPMRRAPHSPLQPVQVMRQKRNLSNLQQLVLPMKKRMVTRQPIEPATGGASESATGEASESATGGSSTDAEDAGVERKQIV